MIKINVTNAKQLITKSKLPDADYVCNPYTGCIHKCIYCYAGFMKRFTNHTEDWGNFLDIKYSPDMRLPKFKPDDTILISSVTDAYNPLERKYEATKKVLLQLMDVDVKVEILTKSSLVLRDIELLKKFKKIKIGISLNTLDEAMRKKTEPFASDINKRLEALQILHKENIQNYAFISPIFPGLSDVPTIIEKMKSYVDCFCFENLNLRAGYKKRVFDFIIYTRPDLLPLYEKIYNQKDMSYWENLKNTIIEICRSQNIEYKIYFYHEKIKKQ